ncbi:MAG: class I SAM-dependent methyltransferase [Phycisphaerales bacterium JB059]
MNAPPDKHALYELCVQSVDHLAPLIRAIHGGRLRVLGEDFAGTAALSHRWVESSPEAQAIAVDLDKEALAYHGSHERIDKRHADVRTVVTPCDALFVGNFSIGYLHTRAELVEYLRHARSRLSPGGVFLCDTYGGESAFLTGEVHRPHPMPCREGEPGGRVCRYTWEQRDADPTTGMVTDVIHFRIERAGVIEHELFDAFVYEWRLWSVPELRDAMVDAGFSSTQVYAKLADAWDEEGNAYVEPVTDGGEELDESFIVLVAGRV